jgi:hypothetical protein
MPDPRPSRPLAAAALLTLLLLPPGAAARTSGGEASGGEAPGDEAPGDEGPGAPSPLSRLRWEGGVDVTYALNPRRPAERVNFPSGTGTSGKRANEVSLTLASLGVTLPAEPVGFRVLVGVGSALEVVHAAESPGEGVGPAALQALQQASLTWKASERLQLEAGIYPSHIGLESLQTQRNWTYTRAWMGELSPYYQAGVKAALQLSEAWSAQLHLLNGWQRVGEALVPGRAGAATPALGTQVAYAHGGLSASFNTFVGEEAGALRLFGDVVASWQATGALQLAASVDGALQGREGPGAPARWAAAALNGRLRLLPALWLAARAEVFLDADGAISGTAQRLAEGTLTLEARPTPLLALKLEARRDVSSAPVFPGRPVEGAGPSTTQTLVVAGATAYLE